MDEKGERGKLLLSSAEVEVEEPTLTQLSRPPEPYRYSDLLIQESFGTQACFWKKLKDNSPHSSKPGHFSSFLSALLPSPSDFWFILLLN